MDLPVGMQSMNFAYCKGLTGAVDKLVLPVGMQSVDLSGCPGLAGAVDKLVLPEGMQSVDFNRCTGLTGAVDKLVLPEGMQNVNFEGCEGLTWDIAQMDLPVGMQSVNFNRCTGLTGTAELGMSEGHIQFIFFCNVLHSSLCFSVSSRRQLSLLYSHPLPHPDIPQPSPQANFRPPKGQRSRTTADRKKSVHTTHTQTHTHRPSTAVVLHASHAPPIFRNTSQVKWFSL
jgi:hypothetical protein